MISKYTHKSKERQQKHKDKRFSTLFTYCDPFIIFACLADNITTPVEFTVTSLRPSHS